MEFIFKRVIPRSNVMRHTDKVSNLQVQQSIIWVWYSWCVAWLPTRRRREQVTNGFRCPNREETGGTSERVGTPTVPENCLYSIYRKCLLSICYVYTRIASSNPKCVEIGEGKLKSFTAPVTSPGDEHPSTHLDKEGSSKNWQLSATFWKNSPIFLLCQRLELQLTHFKTWRQAAQRVPDVPESSCTCAVLTGCRFSYVAIAKFDLGDPR